MRTSLLLRQPVLLLLALLTAPSLLAQVSGISYTAAPVGMRVFFDDNAGLRDSYFYGGQAGLGFGEYLELSGEYLIGHDVETDFSDYGSEEVLQQALQTAYGEQKVDVQRYGGQLRVNIGTSNLLPFLTAGTGVIRFEPDGEDATESIYLTAGGGITLSLADRYTLTLSANRMGYRYSPLATFAISGAGFEEADFPIRTVYNTTVTAALRFYLGGRTPGEQTEIDRALRQQFGAGGSRIFVQPFYGRIDFNGDLANFPASQNVAGASAGVDLGPYVGLRGFYWRATDEEDLFEDPFKFRPMQFYGGELNFRFASEIGAGLTPYLIVGGGYINIDDDYQTEETFIAPDSRFFAQGGVGVDFPLTSSLRLKAAARSLLMSDEDEENLSTPSEVKNSWMYSAGIEFSFGGTSTSAGTLLARQQERERERRAALEGRTVEQQTEIERLRARLDELEGRDSGMSEQDQEEMAQMRRELEALRRQQEDPSRVARREGESTSMRNEGDAARESRTLQRSNLSGETIALPVPEVGEIYVRFGDTVEGTQVETVYGPPIVTTMSQGTATVGAQGVVPPPAPGQPMTPEQTRAMIQEALRSELGAAGAGAQAEGRSLTQEEIRNVVRETMREQLAEMSQNTQDPALDAVARRLSAIEARLAAQPQVAQPPNVTVVDGTPQTTRVVTSQPGIFGRTFVNAIPYLGFRMGEGPNQFLFGVRGDYRRPTGTGMRFMPELAFGFGDGTSIQGFANLVFPVGREGYGTALQPYVGAGAGLVSEKGLRGLGLALNVLGGVEYTVGPGAVMAEFSTLDFFEYNRFLFGYRVRF